MVAGERLGGVPGRELRRERRGGVVLTNLGRDDRLSLEIGDWVELVDDAYVARLDDVAPPLRQVVQLDRATCTVTLNADAANTVGTKPELHPRLRRWDQRPAVGDPAQATDGALTIVAPAPAGDFIWLDLEDGVQVMFPPRSRSVWWPIRMLS